MIRRCDMCRFWDGTGKAGSFFEGGCTWVPPKPHSAPVKRVFAFAIGTDIDDAQRCDVYEEAPPSVDLSW